MKCLRKYKWVKLQRSTIPSGRGLMGYWARLASRAAFRKGKGIYCGHVNSVDPGMWVGGIVGLKGILGLTRRSQVLQVMNELGELGLIKYHLNPCNKKLTYEITDWVFKYCGAPCDDGTAYATDGYGFICMPRNITERLTVNNRIFDEADAWLDLWCHTVYRDYGNAFSFLAPTVQFGTYGCALTLEKLGNRWGWQKTKVWRFFKKNSDTFALYRLPGSYGCLVFNRLYLEDDHMAMPDESDVLCLLDAIRHAFNRSYGYGTDSERLNRMIAWNSRYVVKRYEDQVASAKNGVSTVHSYTRAYFSHGRNCRYCSNCIYDCPGALIGKPTSFNRGNEIRGPCFQIGIFF